MSYSTISTFHLFALWTKDIILPRLLSNPEKEYPFFKILTHLSTTTILLANHMTASFFSLEYPTYSHFLIFLHYYSSSYPGCNGDSVLNCYRRLRKQFHPNLPFCSINFHIANTTTHSSLTSKSYTGCPTS